METTRRRFLQIGVTSALGFTVAGVALTRRTADGAAAGEKGRSWGMAIDMTKCQATQGCRDCTAACHLAHNVPDIAGKQEEIKWIWPEPFAAVFAGQENHYLPEDVQARQFPVLCNHCTNAPCTRVCPTQATFKRPDGIVMMDYHRCVGCRYCMAACPYGARSFNFQDPRPSLKTTNPEYPTREQGVVEKCTFCTERLADGRAPICAAACKHGALIFGDLNDAASPLRKRLGTAFSLRRKAELGTEPKVFYLVESREVRP